MSACLRRLIFKILILLMELFTNVTNNYTNHDVVGVIVFASVMICVAAVMTGITIYVYRSIPDPLNDIEHGVVHLTDTGNRPLTPLTFANVDQPGLYGNVQNENVGDSASSPLTIADISASIPSMVEATIFHSWHTLVIILTCMIVIGIVITISLFHTYSHSCPTLSMHESMSDIKHA